MKVTVDHWVKRDGRWYQSGETYDDGRPEAEEVPEQPAVEPVQEEKAKRTRKRTVKE